MRQLNALGANLKHVEKMPLKMWVGVKRARAEREAKRTADEKAAGSVTGRRTAPGPRSGGGDDGDEDGGGSGQPIDLTPSSIRGPVMFIGGSRGGSRGGSPGGSRGGGARGSREGHGGGVDHGGGRISRGGRNGGRGGRGRGGSRK